MQAIGFWVYVLRMGVGPTAETSCLHGRDGLEFVYTSQQLGTGRQASVGPFKGLGFMVYARNAEAYTWILSILLCAMFGC